jgi:hypothetical protein
MKTHKEESDSKSQSPNKQKKNSSKQPGDSKN